MGSDTLYFSLSVLILKPPQDFIYDWYAFLYFLIASSSRLFSPDKWGLIDVLSSDLNNLKWVISYTLYTKIYKMIVIPSCNETFVSSESLHKWVGKRVKWGHVGTRSKVILEKNRAHKKQKGWLTWSLCQTNFLRVP